MSVFEHLRSEFLPGRSSDNYEVDLGWSLSRTVAGSVVDLVKLAS